MQHFQRFTLLLHTPVVYDELHTAFQLLSQNLFNEGSVSWMNIAESDEFNSRLPDNA